MPKRLTEEQLAAFHDGLCGLSIGDGPCSCLVQWIVGLQKDLDLAEDVIAAARKCLGGGLDTDGHREALTELSRAVGQLDEAS